MPTVPFELTYNVTMDESGVCDGRDLAEGLIRDAYKLLVPYAKTCPACSDALFTAIANSVIEDLQGTGKLTGTTFVSGEEDKRGRFDAHRDATQDKTDRLLRSVGLESH